MGQISAEGIEQLCNDLNLNPEDFRVLVLAYSLGAQAMCRFTEDEFVNGCLRLGITSVETMKQSIPNLLKSVQGASFTPFYHWTYKFALDVESGQRTLPADLAISLWKLVFYQNCPPILDRWLDFLQQNTSIKGISKDTWDMFLIFVNQIGEDLKSYNDAEAWPSLLDDFVESQLALADNI
ncbi:DCUN1D3 [Bugula neritina]|uniref:Defective in cullin neddylation protein n=2 Tax=Bugula neritina TaxID=10212 RepID=A0A7J7KII2_BUGNE|nr:DCUN1D3 [Bugula neritina]